MPSVGAFRKGTTAHLPENFPTPSSTAKVDLDWPPMTGSLVTCHLRSVAEPSKVASTTGDCAESAGASGEGEREREAHVLTTARHADRARGAVWVWAYLRREGKRRESRCEHLGGRTRQHGSRKLRHAGGENARTGSKKAGNSKKSKRGCQV